MIEAGNFDSMPFMECKRRQHDEITLVTYIRLDRSWQERLIRDFFY